eukprot:Sspe_Gene.91314::Locus_62772_Transcript_1_1_Confidence_1.000_Length_573::g.91314::m.91314/K20880/NEK11; NIMA (never in mitosis gene a)-related kinase 11
MEDERIPAWSRYRNVRMLGAGSFGQVYLVEKADAAPGEGVYVIKRTPIGDAPRQLVEASANEVYVLSVLNHPNILRYVDHFVDDESYLNIVTEYCEGGDLANLIQSRRESSTPFTQEQMTFLIFQLLVAIRYTHSAEVMHRDLKPGNVFLTQNFGVKLGDFGISKMMSNQSMACTMVGTPFYLSPE